MGLRFHRRVDVLSGVRLNVGTRGASVSLGHRGNWHARRHGRRRATLGWPGTGLSYSANVPAQRQPKPAASALSWLLVVKMILFAVLVISRM